MTMTARKAHRTACRANATALYFALTLVEDWAPRACESMCRLCEAQGAFGPDGHHEDCPFNEVFRVLKLVDGI